MVKLVEQGRLKPVVSETYPLQEVEAGPGQAAGKPAAGEDSAAVGIDLLSAGTGPNECPRYWPQQSWGQQGIEGSFLVRRGV